MLGALWAMWSVRAELAMVLLLAALAGVDYATRRAEPAAWQPPQQVEPVLGRRAARQAQ
jgi:hypothetical protein